MAAPRFKLHKARDGQFYFTLVARNGRVLMTSETYRTRQGALRGINAAALIGWEAALQDVADTTKGGG